MLIDFADLPQALRDQLTVLRGLVQAALEDFVSMHSGLRVRYTARTEASIIHDNMVWHAKAAGFQWQLKRNLFLFRVGNEFAVKPKKLDQQLRPRNITTQLVLNFDKQRVLKLFDDLDFTHVYLGYQKNGAELSTSSIWLVCPQGRRIRWAAELPLQPTSAVEVAVPLMPTLPEESRERRVRRKQAATDKDAKQS